MAPTGMPQTADPAYRAGALALLASLAVILAALGFEHIGGYRPCPLCLMQRYAFYAGIPALFIALVLVAAGHRQGSALILVCVALGFLANAGLGVYHAGAEWKFWPGPDTCAATPQPLSPSAGGLLQKLESVRVVRCDEAPWRFLGLSFAGWNVVASLLIMIATAQAAVASARR